MDALDALVRLPAALSGAVLFSVAVALGTACGWATQLWLRRGLPAEGAGAGKVHHALVSRRVYAFAVASAALIAVHVAFELLDVRLADPIARARKGIDLALVVLFAAVLLRTIAAVRGARAGSGVEPGGFRGMTQAVQLTIICGALVLLAARATDRSPALVLSGIGAAAALLAIVFRDTLVSFVAGLRLVAEDMVRPGERVQTLDGMVDGVVAEIALHNVRVDNFDGSIARVPNTALLDRPFLNWRGLSLIGGRRIRFTILVDVDGIRFEGDSAGPALPRTLSETNAGAFRDYAEAVLRAHDGINERLPVLVHQLQPTPHGLPIEVYAFSRSVDWAQHELLQSRLLEHLLAALPRFGLRPYQLRATAPGVPPAA